MSDLMWLVVLLSAAIGLAALELVIPSGGILGLCSVLAYVASVIAAFANFGLQWGTVYLFSSIALLGALGLLFVRLWPKTKLGQSILGAPPSGDELVSDRQRELNALVGDHGIALTPMIPSGAIRVRGKVYDAVSCGVVIEADTPVEIVGVKGNHIMVRPVSGSPPPMTDDDVQSALDKPIDMIVPDPFDES